MTTFREFWARSAHFLQTGDWDESRGARVFLCSNPDDLSATSQRPIFTKFDHETYLGVPSRNPKVIFENFHLRGHLPPKSETGNRSNRHLTQSRLQSQNALQRYTVYPHCSPRAKKFPSSGQLFCTTYGCGATGRQSCPIFGFLPIFPIQNP